MYCFSEIESGIYNQGNIRIIMTVKAIDPFMFARDISSVTGKMMNMMSINALAALKNMHATLNTKRNMIEKKKKVCNFCAMNFLYLL